MSNSINAPDESDAAPLLTPCVGAASFHSELEGFRHGRTFDAKAGSIISLIRLTMEDVEAERGPRD